MIRRVGLRVHFKDVFQMHKTVLCSSVQYYICMHLEGGVTSSAAIISSTTYFPISTVFNECALHRYMVHYEDLLT
jgi:hypothetical protein